MDDELINETDLPTWFDLDTFYMFPGANINDDSEATHKISGRQMLMIMPVEDPNLKGNYNVIMELKEKVYIFGLEFCKEMNRWLAAMRKAKITNEELIRTKSGTLSKNVDSYYLHHKKKMPNENMIKIHKDLRNFCGNLEVETAEVKLLIKALNDAQSNFYQTCDSLQSVRPFSHELFKFYLLNYHSQWTDFAKDFWNKRFKEYDGVQILEFLDVVYRQVSIINEFGMNDPRYLNSYNEVIATFCLRTFNNIMPMILEVLEKMKKEFYVEKALCLSHAPVDLFKFINQICDMYKYCKQKEVANGLLSLSYKLITNFQIEFRAMVTECDDMELENFAALTNSNIKFIACMREFLEAMKKETGLSKEYLEKAFQNNFLMKNFAEISNTSYTRIQDLVKNQVSEAFLGIEDYKKVVIQEFIEDLFMSLKIIFEKLYPSYAKRLWKFILDESIGLFVQMLIVCSTKISPDDRPSLIEKMEKDRNNIEELFKSLVSSKDIEVAMEKLDLLIGALKDEIDKVVSHIVKLKISLGKAFNDNCVKCVLRLRKDVSKDEKMALLDIIEKQAATIKSAERKGMGKLFTKSLMTEFRILNYVQKFRERFALKQELMLQKEKYKLNKDMLGLDEESQLEVEEDLINLRGILEFASEKYKDAKELEKMKEKIHKQSYKKKFFSFLEDIISWKEKTTSKQAEGKVYLVTIEEVTAERDLYIVFRTKRQAFFLKCEDSEQRKKWCRAIHFLRDMVMIQNRPLSFDQFSCTTEIGRAHV